MGADAKVVAAMALVDAVAAFRTSEFPDLKGRPNAKKLQDDGLKLAVAVGWDWAADLTLTHYTLHASDCEIMDFMLERFLVWALEAGE